MKTKFRISSRRLFSFLLLLLYFFISSVSINSDANHISEGSNSYSDGIFYLVLDGLLALYLLLSFKGKKVTKLALASLSLIAYQLISAFLIEASDIFLLTMRGVTWGLLLLVFHLYLSSDPSEAEWTSLLFFFFLICLSLQIITKELELRDLGYETGINFVYWVELGIPVIFLLKSNKTKVLLICTIGTAVLLSLKLTALIAFFLPLLLGFLLQYKIRSKIQKKGYTALLLIVLILCFVLPLLADWFNEVLNIDWFSKIDSSYDSGGSGRFDIWKTILSLQADSSFIQWVFGHGYEATIKATGNLSAHNDFLEILYNYGFFGLSLYLSIYYYLIRTTRKLLVNHVNSGIALTVSLIQFFILSLFSHLIIYPRLMLTVSLVWVLCISQHSSNINPIDRFPNFSKLSKRTH